MGTEEYKLFYWPGFPGRGEFIRLLFAETDTPYTDVLRGKSFEEAKEIGYNQTKSFAMPMLDHNGFLMSQTPVICRYLSRHLAGGRLMPKTEKECVEAEVIQAGIVDAVAEGEIYWHPIDKNAGHLDQREAALPFMEYYKTRRLPKWISFYERKLQANFEKSGNLYFVGSDLTYVDLAVFFWIEGQMFECLPEFLKEDPVHLIQFFENIKARPNIKKWLENSERCSFTGTGPCF